MNTLLQIESIHKSFQQSVLKNISFDIQKTSITAIVGESGCGKTTLMRIIAGHEQADSGNIELHGQSITEKPANKRNMGLVFQDYALFPHMNVSKNIRYGMRGKKKKQRIAALLELVNMPDFEKRYPHELSGGQQQRVALARAIAPQPDLLLMDEPFSNLDPIRRKNLRSAVQNLVQETQIAVIIVTHDMDDALKLADEIIVMENGEIVQRAKPQEIQQTPANTYVQQLLD